MRLTAALVIVILAFLSAACSKDDLDSPAALYGKWSKGTNFGDTIEFTRKNNQDIMRIYMYNPQQTFDEFEYKFQKNGKLSIKLYAPEFRTLNSFTWTAPGKEFTIQGVELFLFMSSTLTYFTYRKID